MVRRKTLNHSGTTDEHGDYYNVHLNLYEDELTVAELTIGEKIFVRVRESRIIIQKADRATITHDF